MRNLPMMMNHFLVICVCMALFIANWFQYIEHRDPCIFCLFQRVAMAGIGLCALMNLRFGLRVEHFSGSILFALLGMLVSYRLEPFGPTFWGYQLSTLSSNVFVGSIICQSLLMLSTNAKHFSENLFSWGIVEKSLFLTLTLLVCLNIVTPLLSFY